MEESRGGDSKGGDFKLEIEKKIGHGGCSQVFLAKDTNTGEQFAVKKISPHWIKDEKRKEQLQREIENHLLLDHPNIVKLYGHFEEDDTVSLVCEYIDGGDLHTLLTKTPNCKFQENQAGQLVNGVCLALKYCHDQGIVHSDVKLENVLGNLFFD